MKLILSHCSLTIILAVLAAISVAGCRKEAEWKTIQTHATKGLTISLLSEGEDLKQGKNDFIIEFKSESTQQPMDVGKVTVSSAMPMPGMAPMSAGVEVSSAEQTGRYRAQASFEMSGAWQFAIQWDGPAGQGSTQFLVNVR